MSSIRKLLLLIVLVLPSCLPKNIIRYPSKFASVRCGYFETFEFWNDTIAYHGYVSDSTVFNDTLKVKKTVWFRNHLYFVYQLKTGEIYFLAYENSKSGAVKLASAEALAYACATTECAIQTIKSNKASDSLLFYTDFNKVEDYRNLQTYSKLKLLDSMNIDEFNLLLDTMIEVKKILLKSVSSRTIAKIDILTNHYIVGQSLVKIGYNPFSQYQIFRNLLSKYLHTGVTKSKFEKFNNLY